MTLTTQQIDALRKITSPSVANAIETFKVRPRDEGNVSSSIRALFPEMGPMVGYAVTVVIEPGNPAHQKNGAKLWSDYRHYIASVPGPKIVVVQDLD